MELKFDENNFEQEVLQSDKPVLVDFFATWCGPCSMMAPIVKQLAEEITDIKVGKLDIDQNMSIAQKYRVMSVPTFLIFKEGQVVEKVIGAVSKKELETAIKKVIG